jgi:hypothetical protein
VRLYIHVALVNTVNNVESVGIKAKYILTSLVTQNFLRKNVQLTYLSFCLVTLTSLMDRVCIYWHKCLRCCIRVSGN